MKTVGPRAWARPTGGRHCHSLENRTNGTTNLTHDIKIFIAVKVQVLKLQPRFPKLGQPRKEVHESPGQSRKTWALSCQPSPGAGHLVSLRPEGVMAGHAE